MKSSPFTPGGIKCGVQGTINIQPSNERQSFAIVHGGIVNVSSHDESSIGLDR